MCCVDWRCRISDKIMPTKNSLTLLSDFVFPSEFSSRRLSIMTPILCPTGVAIKDTLLASSHVDSTEHWLS